MTAAAGFEGLPAPASNTLTAHSTALGQLADALAKVQLKLTAVPKDIVGQIGTKKYNYSDLDSVWKTLREAMGEDSGLAVIQTNEVINGQEMLCTTLAHSSGEFIQGRTPIIIEAEHRGINNMQAYGAAMTYARRYGLASCLGVSIGGEDDDGAAASGNAGLEPRGGAKGTNTAKPKAKALTGPIKTMTELKKACQQLATDIAACDDMDTLSGLRTFKPTVDLLKQLETDWPEAHDAERNDKNDFIGMVQRFKERADVLGPQDA